MSTDAWICMYTWKWWRSLSPLSRPSSSSDGNSDISLLFHTFFSSILKGSRSLVHLLVYTNSIHANPPPPPPTLSCLSQMPRLCLPGKPALSAPTVLSHIKKFPPPSLLPSSCQHFLSFTPPGSRGALKTGRWRPDFFFFLGEVRLDLDPFLFCPSQQSSQHLNRIAACHLFLLLTSVFCPLLLLNSSLISTWLCSGSSLPFLSGPSWPFQCSSHLPNSLHCTIVVICCCGNCSGRLLFYKCKCVLLIVDQACCSVVS